MVSKHNIYLIDIILEYGEYTVYFCGQFTGTKELIMKYLSSLLIALCLMAIAVPANAAEFITIGTGGVTGVYYPTGGAVARLVNEATNRKVRASVESTGGSVYNINNVLSGDLNLGFAQSDKQFQAVNGKAEWEGKPQDSLRFLFSIHPESVTIVAADDANINTIEDLKGKVVNIGNPGSGQRYNAIQILEAIGIDPETDIKAEGLKAAECAKMLQDGRIDAYFYTVGHPAGSFKEASAGKRKVHIVPIKGEKIDKMIAPLPFFAKTEIPVKKLYPNMTNEGDTVETIGMLTTIVCSDNENEETMYAAVKAVFENLDKLRELHPALSNLKAEEMATSGKSAPYHPGAEKYFKEAGLAK